MRSSSTASAPAPTIKLGVGALPDAACITDNKETDTMTTNKQPTCGVAVANENERSGWSICGQPMVLDLGETKQVKLADGTLQMGRYLCAEHKDGEVQ